MGRRECVSDSRLEISLKLSTSDGHSYEVKVWAGFRPGITAGLGHDYFSEASHTITGESFPQRIF